MKNSTIWRLVGVVIVAFWIGVVILAYVLT